MSVSNASLTPSEMVFLNGDQFAQKAGLFNKVKLMHTDLSVDGVQLVQMAAAAAFLANEQAGTLRLELRAKKALFGLASVQALYAEPCGALHAWPADTLEAAFPPYAERFKAEKNTHEVYSILYAWMAADRMSPFDEVIDRIRYGLGKRGLLEMREEKKLKVFTVHSYVLPDATRALVQSIPLAPVQQLLVQCEQARPQVWKALLEQIKKAISARREQSDTSFDND
jgi:hypothetical protein